MFQVLSDRAKMDVAEHPLRPLGRRQGAVGVMAEGWETPRVGQPLGQLHSMVSTKFLGPHV